MDTPPPYRRRWRVTFLRGAVALTPAVAVALTLVVFGEPAQDGSGIQWLNSLFLFAFLVAVPALWLIPAGALADHFLSRWGATLLAVVHIGGGIVSFFIWYAGLLVLALVTGQPLGGLFAVVLVLGVPPWMLLGFAVAWLVPGSFPHRRGLVMDGFRWLRRKLQGGTTPTQPTLHPTSA